MKTTVVLLALFFGVLGGGYLLSHARQSDATSPNVPQSATSVSSGSYTSAQVAAHNTSSDCWTSINGSVYDLTKWIGQHPGGEAAILSICGKDGTSAFEAQHGNPRDTRPQQMLATFKIGVLAS